MNWEQIALGLLSLVSALLGFLLRELWEAVKSLRKDLAALEIKMSDNYVKVNAFDVAVTRILSAIDNLREDLARKEDRK
jgi:hypothetical protein